jgi:putative ABC transport system permease protein
MSAGAVHRLPEPSDGLRNLHIVATAVRQIDPVTVAAVGLFEFASTDELRVERAAALAELQRLLAGDVSSFGRELIIAVLLGGMLLVGLAVLVEVLARRRDLGRQRVLGAQRSTVIMLLAVRTGAAAAMGSSVGLATGLAYLSLTTREVPEPSFSAGLVVLSILTPSLASIVPAWWAALRDPVLELRTP